MTFALAGQEDAAAGAACGDRGTGVASSCTADGEDAAFRDRTDFRDFRGGLDGDFGGDGEACCAGDVGGVSARGVGGSCAAGGIDNVSRTCGAGGDD